MLLTGDPCDFTLRVQPAEAKHIKTANKTAILFISTIPFIIYKHIPHM